MSNYDLQYLSILENILENGFQSNDRTGTGTIKLPHQVMQFNLQKEFPILTTKFVAFDKKAKPELFWIYRDQSNDVTLLQEQGVHIWDEWADKRNKIGKAYGYQIKKFKQIDKLIHALKNNPEDRRMMLNMWNFQDLKKMNLPPCAFLTMWDVTDGYLNCMLIQRSGDWGLGIPFNTSQYALLVHLLAQVTNLKPGLFTHVINNAHVYNNHIEPLTLHLSRKDQALPAPTLSINPNIKNFYDFKSEDIQLINYEHLGKIKMKVSV